MNKRCVTLGDDGCSDANEVRRQCSPNKRCVTCGETACPYNCVVNGCACKEGYKYKNGICVPVAEC
ncbi:hypothetical protein B4U80_13882 [Leptotrombidium deliense]|uniref:TIL domain-containing protein n=1 Tax=Leptotrombidium deliense TaxID=299467 RepID=A0A443S9M1_9ACAR|nr:hypothetical protein B4U80_13882 [Leptotrombidium deliense]